METRSLRLVLGDQLNPQHSWYQAPPASTTLYVLLEVRAEATHTPLHLKKLAVFFAAMRRFAAWLTSQGHRVQYHRIHQPGPDTFVEHLQALLETHTPSSFEYQAPDDYALDRSLADFCHHLPIQTACVSTEHFLTERSDLATLMRGKTQWRMETFYRHERQRLGILLEPDGGPVGGKWNFDHANRNPPPKDLEDIPPAPSFGNDYREVLSDILAAGIPHFGNADGIDYPLDRSQALHLLQAFVQHRLQHFGTYQDAMHTDASLLYHSLLSFALNAKLLSPKEVVNRVLEAYHADPERYDLAQVEGFIRQVIGWREYMRGIYWAHMPGYANTNHLNAQRPLPAWYWTGQTRMNCLHHAIRNSLDNAYAHHIQRLMVTGNFATLIGVTPHEINAWYLGIYADALEWVQLPNTHGMSQFADGGLIATKPYVSSGSYIQKMSNYCQGCTYNVKAKTGPGSCPFNSLYWHFLHRNADTLRGNFRMAQMYATWDKMAPAKQTAYLETAEQYLATVESL